MIDYTIFERYCAHRTVTGQQQKPLNFSG